MQRAHFDDWRLDEASVSKADKVMQVNLPFIWSFAYSAVCSMEIICTNSSVELAFPKAQFLLVFLKLAGRQKPGRSLFTQLPHVSQLVRYNNWHSSVQSYPANLFLAFQVHFYNLYMSFQVQKGCVEVSFVPESRQRNIFTHFSTGAGAVLFGS